MKKKIKNFLFLLMAIPLVLLDEFIDNFKIPSKDDIGEFLACICFVGILVGVSAIILIMG